MKWYKKDNGRLDMDRPIMATCTSGTFLLLPQLDSEKSGYAIIGYNWFNLEKGEYNSCNFFKTPEEAIHGYSQMAIKNANINMTSDYSADPF